jgi:hypothetical protein
MSLRSSGVQRSEDLWIDLTGTYFSEGATASGGLTCFPFL